MFCTNKKVMLKNHEGGILTYNYLTEAQSTLELFDPTKDNEK